MGLPSCTLTHRVRHVCSQHIYTLRLFRKRGWGCGDGSAGKPALPEDGVQGPAPTRGLTIVLNFNSRGSSGLFRLP